MVTFPCSIHCCNRSDCFISQPPFYMRISSCLNLSGYFSLSRNLRSCISEAYRSLPAGGKRAISCSKSLERTLIFDYRKDDSLFDLQQITGFFNTPIFHQPRQNSVEGISARQLLIVLFNLFKGIDGSTNAGMESIRGHVPPR